MTATATIVIRNNGLISTQFSRPMNPMLDSTMSQALARINQAIRSAAARLRLTPCFDSLRTQGISGSALGFELQFRSKDGRPLNPAGHMTVRLCDDHLPRIGVEFHPGLADSERSLRVLAHDCIQEAFYGQQRQDWRHEKTPFPLFPYLSFASRTFPIKTKPSECATMVSNFSGDHPCPESPTVKCPARSWPARLSWPCWGLVPQK